MKISQVAFILLLVTLVFFTFGELVLDFETNYLDTNISYAQPLNDSSISDIDDTDFINETIQPVKDGFDAITGSDGFFDAIGNFAVVIPKAVISVPGVIFEFTKQAYLRMTAILNILGIPVEIIYIAGIALTLFTIFSLIKFWHREPI